MSDRPDITRAPEERGQLQKHPNDGWPLAEPYPMGKSTIAAMHGIIRALSPPEPRVEDMEERIAGHWRCFMRYMHPVVAFALLLAIHLLDWAPIWRFKHLSRLRKLSTNQASTLIDNMSHSSFSLIRTLILGVRAIVGTAFYDQKEVHEALDYEPEAWMASRIALRKRLLDAQATADEGLIGPYSHVRIDE